MYKLFFFSADWKDREQQDLNEAAAEKTGLPHVFQFGNRVQDEYVVIATDCPDLEESILGSGTLEDEDFGHCIIWAESGNDAIEFENVEALRKTVEEAIKQDS